MLARTPVRGKPSGALTGTSGTVVNRPERCGVPVVGSGLRSRRMTWETPEVLSTAVTVLAHQGGWDEMLMVLTPIAVFALLLKLANSRANKAQAEAREAAQATDARAEGDPGPAGDEIR